MAFCGNCLEPDSADFRCDICEERVCEECIEFAYGVNQCATCLDRNEFYDVDKVAELISIPTDKWHGRCHEIAKEMLKAYRPKIKATLCYGIYNGYIHPKSLFGGRPLTHHGWLKPDDDFVIDPTRWVFEHVEPYIYYGHHNDEYDFGGNALREVVRINKTAPAFKAERAISLEKLPKQVKSLIEKTVETQNGKVGIEQLFYMANLSLKTLDKQAKPFYQFLISKNLGGLIPIDNRRLIVGKQ